MDQGKTFNTLLAAFFAIFVIGFGMGFSVHYALSNSPGQRSYAADVPAEGASETGASGNAPEPAEELATLGVWPGRHLFIGLNGQWLSDASRELLREVKPGGVVLGSANLGGVRQTLNFVREIKEAVSPSDPSFSALPLIAVSHEGGERNELGLAIAPGASELGGARDTRAARGVGVDLAAEAADRGINVVFGPVLDIYDSSSYYPSLAARSYGSDGELVAAMGLAVADGMMEGGVIPVVKHFPGYGSVSRDPNTGYAVMNGDSASLATAIFPFEKAVQHGIPGVLVGHTAIPFFSDAREGIEPGRPASLAPMIVNGILREVLEYEGVIIAGDLSSDRVIRERGIAKAAVEALAAGCDALILLDADPELVAEVCRAIEAAVDSGALSRVRLDRSKARLDEWREWLDEPSGLLGPLPQLETPIAVAAQVPSAQPEPFAITPTATVQEISIGDAAQAAGGFDLAEMAHTSIEDAEIAHTAIEDLAAGELSDETSAIAEPPARIESPAEAAVDATPVAENPAPVDSEREDPGFEGPASPEEGPLDDSSEGVDPPGPGLAAGAEESDTNDLDRVVTGPTEMEGAAAEVEVGLDSPGESAGNAEAKGEEFDSPEPQATAAEIEAEGNALQPEGVGGENDGEGVAQGTETAAGQPLEEPTAEMQPGVPAENGGLEPDGGRAGEAEPSAPEIEPAPDSPEEDSLPEPIETEAAELVAVSYTVEVGESLEDVAQAYAVSAASLREWNRIEGDTLEAGTTLEIRIPPLQALVAGPTATPNRRGETAPGTADAAKSSELPEQTVEIHTVEKDETLTSISALYDVGIADIQVWNKMAGTALNIGQKLTVYPGASASPEAKAAMPKTGTYRVQRGDGLAKIAKQFGTTVRVLQDLNNLSNPNQIVVGTRLKVPVK